MGQSRIPDEIVLVNDCSTDETENILKDYCQKFPNLQFITTSANSTHEPGAKVVAAFYKGYEQLKDFDLVGKFDADIILPPNYFEILEKHFKSNPELGMASGHLYIEKNEHWVYESIADSEKIRGPIKLYRKACFDAIGGIRPSIGWDTVDQLLAKHQGWQTLTDSSLKVKHLKPTGAHYASSARLKQGMAFRRMRYGFWLSLLASVKLGYKKGSFRLIYDCMLGYFKNGKNYIVTPEEGAAIRRFRWAGVKKKLYF